MARHILCALILCGCSFDLSALGPRDGGPRDSMADAQIDAQILVDASDAEIDATTEIDSGSDSGSDVGTDAAVFDSGSDASMFADAGPDSGPPLTCTDVPDISGSYRITHRLMGCTETDYGYVPLTRLSACEYEFDDGTVTNPIFDGPCDVILLGSLYTYECDIRHGVWRYRCTLVPVSGGLNVDCRFVSGTSPLTTDPCSFFAPSA